jgi:hypothetical protein
MALLESVLILTMKSRRSVCLIGGEERRGEKRRRGESGHEADSEGEWVILQRSSAPYHSFHSNY